LEETKKKPGRVSLRDEPQPDPAALELVARIEASGVRLREETLEEFDARLAAWRAAEPPARSRRARAAWVTAEPDVDDLVEDRSACDFEGLSLDELAATFQAALPGLVHGFSPSLPPDAPTPPRHDPRELRAALAKGRPPTLSAAFVRCLQRRVRLGMAMHNRADFPRLPPIGDWSES
jgi:hypothetical protein